MALPCLETLSHKCTDSHRGACPVLNHRCSSSLKSLHLVAVTPDRLDLLPSCRLHVGMRDKLHARNNTWQSPQLPWGSLTSEMGDLPSRDVLDIVEAIQGHLPDIAIRAPAVGNDRGAYMLGGKLCEANRLTLRAHLCINVIVPKQVAWRLNCGGKLGLQFVNRSALVKQLPSLLVSCLLAHACA